ncbi:MAG: hypothetical protein R2909_05020 [Gemmatimonadales bacterium]
MLKGGLLTAVMMAPATLQFSLAYSNDLPGARTIGCGERHAALDRRLRRCRG